MVTREERIGNRLESLELVCWDEAVSSKLRSSITINSSSFRFSRRRSRRHSMMVPWLLYAGTMMDRDAFVLLMGERTCQADDLRQAPRRHDQRSSFCPKESGYVQVFLPAL